MAEQRYRTVIEIGVEDREVRGLDETISRAFDDRTLIAFERAIERSTRSMSKLVRESEKLERVLRRVEGLQGGFGGGGGAGGGGGLGAPPVGGGGGGGGGDIAAALNNVARSVQQLQSINQQQGRQQIRRTAVGTAIGRMATGSMGGTAIQSLVTAIPWIGPVLGAGMGAMQQFYQEHMGVREAEARNYGTTGMRGTRGTRMAGPAGRGQGFQRFGYDPGQAVSQVANISRQTGRRGGQGGARGGLYGAGGSFVPRLMEAQEYMGLGQLGGITGAAETAGGQVADPTTQIMQAISSGVVTGIRVSRLDRYFSQIASTVEDMRSRGFDISPESLMQASQGFGQLGRSPGGGNRFQGASGAAMARSMTGAMTGGLGRTPGVASLVALRAAGYGQGGVGYQEALRRIQSGDPAVMQSIVTAINDAAGNDPAVAAEMHTQLGQSLYGRVPSQVDADALASGDTSFLTGGVSTRPGQEALAAAAEGGTRAQAASAGEAGYRAGRQRLGGRVAAAGGVQAMRNADLRVLGIFLPRISGAIDSIVDFISGTMTAFDEGGITGAMAHMGSEIVGGILRHMSAAITEAFGGMVVLMARALNSIPGVSIDIGELETRVAQHVAATRRMADDPEGAMAGARGEAGTARNVITPRSARSRRQREQFRNLASRHAMAGGTTMPPRPEGSSVSAARWSQLWRDYQEESGGTMDLPFADQMGGGPHELDQEVARRAQSLADVLQQRASQSGGGGASESTVSPGEE